MAEKTKPTGFHDKLVAIQSSLKAPKNQFNKFGNYKYRNAEDILEAVKPLLKEHGLRMKLSDSLEQRGDRYYVKAVVDITDGIVNESVAGWAREEETKKGMDGSQITGASSSYARKYALNGMFLIDDTKDSDGTNDGTDKPKPASKPAAKTNTSTPSTKPATSPQATEAPNEAAQTATTGKKEVAVNSPAFKGMVAWVATYEAGTVDEAIDSLGGKYNITDEVRKNLREQALISRKPELPK